MYKYTNILVFKKGQFFFFGYGGVRVPSNKRKLQEIFSKAGLVFENEIRYADMIEGEYQTYSNLSPGGRESYFIMQF